MTPKPLISLLFAIALGFAACAKPVREAPASLAIGAAARSQVDATERAFAKTMADRDLAAFGSFIAEEAVFFSGPSPLHGRAAVIEWWSRYYKGAAAPFSWEPDKVEVLASGTLALSTGPVHGPDGKIIARFSSIWRQEAPGVWRIVFDHGEPAP
jgi:ketosteroid isomerase-like protein